jgi:hypothetical protein
MTSRSFAPFLAAAGVLAATACGDPTRLRATLEIEHDTLVAYALNGTSPDLPSGLNTPFHEVVRADGSLTFDVAFDIDANGRVLLLSLNRVLGTPSAGRLVGVQDSVAAYETIVQAPSVGYSPDSILVLSPRFDLGGVERAGTDTVAIVRAATSYCQFDLSPYIFSKIVVDSVDLATRAVYFRIAVDPNCGFKSFRPGIPQS